MLRLERVSKFYSANGLVSTGFSKVDLSFSNGEFVAITGESGSGKSTLLNVISGLDSFEEGEMYIMGQPTSGFSKEDLEEYRKKYIGNIFQTFNLINSYTVYQNVELVLLMSGYDKEVIPGKVKEIIAKVGLSDYEKTKASKLSGGQKQRVAIARALAKETPIIVADEPTGNLDSKSAAEIIELLHQLSHDKLIIIVTHNYDQVEPYVTRKIAMHDGRVAEDKHFDRGAEGRAQAEEAAAAEVKTARAEALSFGNMARLGVRNTFNIPAKFFLLLAVFVFLCIGVIGQYASVMNMNDLVESQGYNNFFTDTGKSRILVSKENRGTFSDSDYNKLQTIANVDHIEKNDLMLDLSLYISNDPEGGDFYTTCKTGDLDIYKELVTEGRLPENSREAVLLMPKDGYAASTIDMMKSGKIWVMNQNTGTKVLKEKVKIVGYGYLNEEQEKALQFDNYGLEAFLCMNEEAMSNIRQANLERYCSQEIYFSDYILNPSTESGQPILTPSDKVPRGEIYIPEEIAAYAEGWAAGRDLTLVNKSLYFTDSYDFTVGAVYNKDNLNYYLGLDNFEEVSGSIFVNSKDYNKIFDKGNFQSSVIVKDEKTAKATQAEIEEMGYQTFYVNDGLVSWSGGFEIIQTTMFTLMLAGVLIVLFFITYFITKLILKSRNVYFSTIRMLGATKKNCSDLLKMELFVVFNIAFFICMGVLALIQTDVIHVQTLTLLTSYLDIKDFAVLYIVLCLMSILLAARYARQLFKKTAMNAYKEEV